MYCVVRFVEEDEVSYVPHKWFNDVEGSCAWPLFPQRKRQYQALANCETPKKNSSYWDYFEAVLKEKNIDTLEAAENAVKKYQVYTEDDEIDFEDRIITKSKKRITFENPDLATEKTFSPFSKKIKTSMPDTQGLDRKSAASKDEQIIRKLENIEKKYDEIGKKIDSMNESFQDGLQKLFSKFYKIDQRLGVLETKKSEFSIPEAVKSNLPINGKAELMTLVENWSEEEEKSMTQYMYQFASEEGYKKSINFIMRRLLTDKACEEIGLRETENKAGLEKTPIFVCLTNAVMKKHKVNISQIGSQVGQWIRGYKSRNGEKKKKKMEKEKQAEQEKEKDSSHNKTI